MQVNAAGDGVSYNTGLGTPGSSGSNLLVGGSGDDVLYGDSSGHSTLQGGSGVESYTSGTAGRLEQVDTLADPITQTTSTTISVNNPAAFSTETGQNVIQIDDEQMLVTGIDSSTNTLTVERGYNNTTAATHAATEAMSVRTASGQEDTLAAATDATTTTITVADASLFSDSQGDNVIEIDGEEMLVTSVNDTTNQLTVTRGYDSTKPATHSQARAVDLVVNTAIDLVVPPAAGSVTSGAGSVNDTLYAGTGGDYLDAGTGTDAIYGGPGNDSIQLQFTPISQQQPQDTIRGGGGEDMLVLDPSPVTSVATADPISTQVGALAAAVTSTSTSISVTDPAAFSSASNVIQIGGEQMLVTGVNLSSGTLTVVRGYNNTTPATHDDGAAIDGEPQLPSASNYYIYFDQVTGTTNQYVATLSSLGPNDQPGTVLGQVNVDMLEDSYGQVDIQNVAIEGGTGDNVIRVDPSVTRNMYLFGGPGSNTLMAGSGSDTLVAGTGTSVLYGGAATTSSTAVTCRHKTPCPDNRFLARYHFRA